MAATHLRYVVLRHDGIADPHFDFMYEPAPDEPLRTFRLDAWPPASPDAVLEATEIAPHRRAYLDYEGPVSGDRGFVRRVAAGELTAEQLPDGVLLLTSADFQLRLK